MIREDRRQIQFNLCVYKKKWLLILPVANCHSLFFLFCNHILIQYICPFQENNKISTQVTFTGFFLYEEVSTATTRITLHNWWYMKHRHYFNNVIILSFVIKVAKRGVARLSKATTTLLTWNKVSPWQGAFTIGHSRMLMIIDMWTLVSLYHSAQWPWLTKF